LSSTDPDVPAQSFTYALVGGAGSADNAAFTISGNQLKTAAGFDFETKASYSIRIRTTDSGSPPLSFDKTFAIAVPDVNEATTGVTPSPSPVPQNQPAGIAVGSTAATDAAMGDTSTFALACAGADNAAFSISGAQLKTAAGFNFEAKASYSICVR